MTATARRTRHAPDRVSPLGPLLGAFLLAGCNAATGAALQQGLVAARQAKDAEAEALKVAVCAMGLGAYHRVNSEVERRALDVLCGGTWERPLTADDLDLLRVLRELRDGS